MDTKRNIFDESIKNVLQDMAAEPSARVWKGISRKLAWKEFVRFDFSNFTSNIYQIAAVGIAGLSLSALLVTTVIKPWADKPEKLPAPVQETLVQPTLPEEESQTTSADATLPTPISQQPGRHTVSVTPAVNPPVLVEESAKPTFYQRQQSTIQRLGSRKAFLAIDYKASIVPGDTGARIIFLPKAEKGPWQLNLGIGWSWNRMHIATTPEAFDYNFSTLGLSFMAQKGNFRTGVGIGYHRLFDRLPYQINYKTFDSTGFVYNVHYYMPDPAHPEMVILVTSKETLYDSVNHTVTSYTTGSYDYLTVPVSIGYRVVAYKNLSITADGSLSMSWLLHSNEPTPALFNPLKSSLALEADLPRRKNFLLDLQAGLSLEYTLFGKINLTAGPAVRWWLQPLSDAPGADKPSAWGLKAGLRYKF